jgi:DNA-binding transcriptional regulator/RsmH inhibitor MraZ
VESTEGYEAPVLYQSLLQSGQSGTESASEPSLDVSFSGVFTLPTGFADASATVIATAGLPRSVLLLDNDHWRSISEKLLRSDRLQESHTATELKSLILGNAVELAISTNRTVDLPDHLLKYAEIDGEITSFSRGAAIEIVRAEAPHPRE